MTAQRCGAEYVVKIPMSRIKAGLELMCGVHIFHKKGGTRIAQAISSELSEKLKAAEFCGVLFDEVGDIIEVELGIVHIVSVSSSLPFFLGGGIN